MFSNTRFFAQMSAGGNRFLLAAPELPAKLERKHKPFIYPCPPLLKGAGGPCGSQKSGSHAATRMRQRLPPLRQQTSSSPAAFRLSQAQRARAIKNLCDMLKGLSASKRPGHSPAKREAQQRGAQGRAAQGRAAQGRAALAQLDGVIIDEGRNRERLRSYLFFNKDGSGAEMCGNGAAVIALYRQKGAAPQKFLVSGRQVKALCKKGQFWIELQLEKPLTKHEFVFQGRRFSYTLSAPGGAPHKTLHWREGPLLKAQLRALARALRKPGAGLKNGANVTFYQKAALKQRSIAAVTYERGVEGWTDACGTGAVAAALSAFPAQNQEVSINMPGGELKVKLSSPPQLSSPAQWGWK